MNENDEEQEYQDKQQIKRVQEYYYQQTRKHMLSVIVIACSQVAIAIYLLVRCDCLLHINVICILHFLRIIQALLIIYRFSKNTCCVKDNINKQTPDHMLSWLNQCLIFMFYEIGLFIYIGKADDQLCIALNGFYIGTDLLNLSTAAIAVYFSKKRSNVLINDAEFIKRQPNTRNILRDIAYLPVEHESDYGSSDED